MWFSLSYYEGKTTPTRHPFNMRLRDLLRDNWKTRGNRNRPENSTRPDPDLRPGFCKKTRGNRNRPGNSTRPDLLRDPELRPGFGKKPKGNRKSDREIDPENLPEKRPGCNTRMCDLKFRSSPGSKDV